MNKTERERERDIESETSARTVARSSRAGKNIGQEKKYSLLCQFCFNQVKVLTQYS